MLSIDKIPKKINEINYFKKCENGSILYSFSEANETIIIVELCKFEIEKDFCVDAKTVETMKLLVPIDKITIDKELKIFSKKGKLKTKLLPNALPRFDENFDKKIEIDLEKLVIASGFVDTKGARLVLSGVNVDSEGNVNASDSLVAFRSKGKAIDSVGEKLSIIIPKDFISFMAKEISGMVAIEFNGTSCRVVKGERKYISRLIFGTYPSLSKVYEAANQSDSILFNYEEFFKKYSVLKKITNGKGVNVLKFENGKIVSKGEEEFEFEICPKNNADYKFFVSQNNFDSVFSKITGEQGQLELKYVSSQRPIFITEKENEFLIMPMRGDE